MLRTRTSSLERKKPLPSEEAIANREQLHRSAVFCHAAYNLAPDLLRSGQGLTRQGAFSDAWRKNSSSRICIGNNSKRSHCWCTSQNKIRFRSQRFADK
jgi:hypothetical protein